MKIIRATFLVKSILLAIVIMISGCTSDKIQTLNFEMTTESVSKEVGMGSVSAEPSTEIVALTTETSYEMITDVSEEVKNKAPRPFEYREEIPGEKYWQFRTPLGFIDYCADGEYGNPLSDFYDYPAYSQGSAWGLDVVEIFINKRGNYPCRLTEYLNQFTAMKNIHADSSVVKEILLDATAYKLTDRQIDALLSLEEEKVLKEFATDWCIVKGVNFYSAAWLYQNDLEAYEKAGITVEEIYGILKLCRTLPAFDGDFLELKLCQYAQITGSSLTVEEICGYNRDINMPQPYYELKGEEAFGYFYFKDIFSFNTPWPYYTNFHSDLDYLPIGQNTTLDFDVENEKIISNLISKKFYYITDEEEINILTSRNAGEIIRHFAKGNKTVLLRGDHFYSFAWVYYSKPETYLIEGLTPDELISMLPKYEELDILTDEAMTALKNKLYGYKESYEAER